MSLICIQTFFIFSTFLLLLGFLFFLITFSCCISPLSCSVCLLFEVNVWLIFELLPDSLLVFSCYSILGFCASNFPEIICGSFATFANKQWHILNISKTFGNLFKAQPSVRQINGTNTVTHNQKLLKVKQNSTKGE